MDDHPSDDHSPDSNDDDAATADSGESASPSSDSTSPYSPRPANEPDEPDDPMWEPRAAKDHDQLRQATASMVQGEFPFFEEAAPQGGIGSNTQDSWIRPYADFAGEMNGEAAARRPERLERLERVAIDEATTEKYNSNWEEMMRRAELERPQLSPLRQKFIRSPFTRWMYSDARVETLTVTGAIAVVAFSLLAAKVATSDRGSNLDDSAAGSTWLPLGAEAEEHSAEQQQRALLDRTVDALRQFAELETWQERLPFVRGAERVGPLMESYYKSHPDGRLTKLIINPEISFLTREDGQFVFIQASLVREDSPNSNLIFLVEVTGGDPELLFDWEVLVNYEPIPWEEFTASKSTNPAPFRVRVLPGDYYNEPFMDSDEFASFQIQPLYRDAKAFAFVARNSKIATQIAANLDKELGWSRAMILNLRYPDAARFGDVLEIESIIADGWLGKSEKKPQADSP